MSTVSKVFATVNQLRSKEYSDYRNLQIQWSPSENYQIVRKIGRGKYSEVFEGLNVAKNERCVIKVLKPVRFSKIVREISILMNVRTGPNISPLLDLIKDPVTNDPSLIMKWVDNCDYKALYASFTDNDCRYYLFKILQALYFSHSNGIMHRDIKPQNIMVDHRRRELFLIDWGLADYYVPNAEYQVRVASRHYKGPELLLNCQKYNYSLDMWSFGCTMAGMVFKKEPFFKGDDNFDQLVKIVQVLGYDDLQRYMTRYHLSLDSYFQNVNLFYAKRPFSTFRSSQNIRLASNEAIDLLSRILVFDHQERLTAEEAMDHPYFDPVRDSLLRQTN